MSSAEKTPVSLADLPPCPVETTLTLISDKWKVLILRDLLLHGTMRFGELKKSIGHVTQTDLTAQLRARWNRAFWSTVKFTPRYRRVSNIP